MVYYVNSHHIDAHIIFQPITVCMDIDDDKTRQDTRQAGEVSSYYYIVLLLVGCVLYSLCVLHSSFFEYESGIFTMQSNGLIL